MYSYEEFLSDWEALVVAFRTEFETPQRIDHMFAAAERDWVEANEDRIPFADPRRMALRRQRAQRRYATRRYRLPSDIAAARVEAMNRRRREALRRQLLNRCPWLRTQRRYN